ncbi:ParB/RepB/Spo0J family partition protein [bacterium]|nr:ParB/RepB/Spo0J family partition protein [bacterium]MDD5918503.1 ParB/RepB/Spo0J family partition protein [bacterium]MDD6046193.1 ParB/RepB/Spo0J family partition protein [bacterium]
MAMKKGLGRGLDALLGDYTAAPPEGVRQTDVYLIDTNADQPRKTFDEEKLRELADSIARHGMVQPIIVRQNGERFVIVAGERRFRAARMAGLTQVPVIVKALDDAEVMEVALIENLQRENLNPIEEAAAIRFLMEQHDLTQEEVAKRLAKSRPAIANSLRLLNLDDGVQDYVREGKLSAGAARALVAVKDVRKQRTLAQEAALRGLSVREVERRAHAANNEEEIKRMKAEQKAEIARGRISNDLYAAQEQLRERLGTRVTISGTEEQGKLVLEYYSRDMLEGLYELLMRQN